MYGRKEFLIEYFVFVARTEKSFTMMKQSLGRKKVCFRGTLSLFAHPVSGFLRMQGNPMTFFWIQEGNGVLLSERGDRRVRLSDKDGELPR